MADTLTFRKRRGGRWAVQGVLAVLILAVCYDYGKHVVLKRVLEREAANSQGLVSLGPISISLWPLGQSHLVLTNFHVHAPGASVVAKTVSVRQGWSDWRLAHIHATEVKAAGTVRIQETRGILDIAGLKTHVKVSQLILKDIQVQLPLLAFSGKQASCDFLYDMASRRLSLNVDAPDLSFPNGVTFGLNGEGVIEAKPPIQGEMAVKLKNIDKMMEELVTAGVVEASQAGLVTASSDFLGKIGLHDITLPLKIKDGDVSLGPVHLFRVGKSEPDLILP